jgi:hypothetical protein
MKPESFNFIGLIFSFAGAVTLALGLIVTKERALRVGLPLMASDKDEDNLCLPHVRDRMRLSRLALVGVVMMALGFLLQIVGNWPGCWPRWRNTSAATEPRHSAV